MKKKIFLLPIHNLLNSLVGDPPETTTNLVCPIPPDEVDEWHWENITGHKNSDRYYWNKSKKTLTEELCRRLNFEYYGFLLYDKRHKRLHHFLKNDLSTLDNISGSKFLIFTLVEKHNTPLNIETRQLEFEVDRPLIDKIIYNWRNDTTLFNPSRSVAILEGLGLQRGDAPCLIIYRRTCGKAYRGFAILKMKDKWFPKIPENDKSYDDDKSYQQTIEWLSHLFDSLEKAIKIPNNKKAILEMQNQMNKLARHQTIYYPIFENIKNGLIPITKLPFKLIVSLADIVENVSTSIIKNKLESLRE